MTLAPKFLRLCLLRRCQQKASNQMDGKIFRRDFVWLSISDAFRERSSYGDYWLVVAPVDNGPLIKSTQNIFHRSPWMKMWPNHTHPTDMLPIVFRCLKTHNSAEIFSSFLVAIDHKIFKLKSKKLRNVFFRFFVFGCFCLRQVNHWSDGKRLNSTIFCHWSR